MCISPFWQAGDRSHFLLNDMLELWPPTDLIPRAVPFHEDREEAYQVGA